MGRGLLFLSAHEQPCSSDFGTLGVKTRNVTEIGLKGRYVLGAGANMLLRVFSCSLLRQAWQVARGRLGAQPH